MEAEDNIRRGLRCQPLQSLRELHCVRLNPSLNILDTDQRTVEDPPADATEHMLEVDA